MERLSKLGFESQALGYTECFQKSYDSALSTVDNEVENIARVSSKGTPPILVAHGVGTFVAQKYLESYAASGLVMIAPFPPHPKNTLKRIIGATLKDLLPVDSSGVLEDLNHLVKLEPDPSGLLQDAARPENVLNLEPLGQFMDVLLVSTLTDPIVTQRDMTAIRNLHELLDDDSQSLTFNGSKGHLTMAEASWEETGGISDQIVDWIDRRY
jgi:pimeloyl-ACP methyl ester carboxylesterase